MDDTCLVVADVRAVRVRVAVLRVVAVRVVAIRGVATVANVDYTRVACVARLKSTKQSQEEQKTHR